MFWGYGLKPEKTEEKKKEKACKEKKAKCKEANDNTNNDCDINCTAEEESSCSMNAETNSES